MSFLYGSFLWLLLPLGVYLFKRKHSQSLGQNLRWGVLVLLIVALARPVLSEHHATQKIRTHSLVIALDLSRSMSANDILPSRAKASRAVIHDFLAQETQEQIALVGFTSNPLILSPPTTDHRLVQVALESLKSQYILTKGTDLFKLFEKIAQFKGEHKLVILFSDGGEKHVNEALLSFLKEQNIKLLVMAMATIEGASVTQEDGKLLVDKAGHIVVSKLNGGLEHLAVQTGGKFVTFSSRAKSVSEMNRWIAKEALDEKSLQKESRSYFDLLFIPLLFAIGLFFLSSTRFSKKLLALLLLMGINLQADTLLTKEHWGEGVQKVEETTTSSWNFLEPYYLHKAYDLYGKKEYLLAQKAINKLHHRGLEATLLLAHTHYKLAHYKLAKSLLQSIHSTDPKVKAQLYFELGNCEAKMHYFQKAKAYYLKALQLKKDDDAFANLAWVTLHLHEENAMLGYVNPSSAQQTSQKSNSDNLEEDESTAKKHHAKNQESKGGAGGSGSKKSKSSTVKIVKKAKANGHKRTFSSKAYDLINEGYIVEDKPW